MGSIRYVEKLDSYWRYRRVIPQELRPVFGAKTAWVKTWPLTTPASIVAKASEVLAVEHSREIARARGRDFQQERLIENVERSVQSLGESDRHRMIAFVLDHGRDRPTDVIADPETGERRPIANDEPDLSGPRLARHADIWANVLKHDGKYAGQGISIRVAFEADKESAEDTGKKRDTKPIAVAVASFEKTVQETDIRQITVTQCEKWVAASRRQGHAPATIRRRINALRALMNRQFARLGHDAKNPFSTVTKDVGGAHKSEDRLPFHTSHLALLDSYVANSKRVKPQSRDLLELLRYTGAGIGEIGGLELRDVILGDLIPFIFVRENDQRGMKTGEIRKRKVPLVGPALDAAKRAAARVTGNSKKVPGDTPLFDGFDENRGADHMSAAINALIRRAGVPKSPRLTSYSFRHSIVQALRDAETPTHVEYRLVGHTIGKDSHGRYGASEVSLERLRDALTKALPLIGKVDLSNYRDNELPNEDASRGKK